MVRSAQEGNPEGVLFDGSNIGLRAGPRQVQCAFRDKTTAVWLVSTVTLR
jgi:hypothetical protein